MINMTDTIVLLEEQKEITTFLLDDGTKTIVNDVITPTGSNLGFEYSDKCMVDDILCISEKSRIGSESLKKFTGIEVPVGILVNEPVVMTNGDRKGRVLLLGGLYRLKLSSSQTVKPGDRIKLTSDGATVDNEGQFIAFHPVNDSDEYELIDPAFSDCMMSKCHMTDMDRISKQTSRSGDVQIAFIEGNKLDLIGIGEQDLMDLVRDLVIPVKVAMHIDAIRT